MYKNIFYDKTKNIVHLWDSESGYKNFEYVPYAYRKKTNGRYISIFGDALEKVYKFNSRYDDSLFESDVPVETRVLIDLYGDDDSTPKNHCILNYDIEVCGEGGYAETIDPWQPIISIAFKDSITNVRNVYVLDVGNRVKDAEFDDDKGPVIIRTFTEESSLLSAFLNKYEEIQPTILTGWNIDEYDNIYLYNRIKKVLDPREAKRLSPIGVAYVKTTKSSNVLFIAGVACLDYMKLYNKFTYIEHVNLRLDTIGRNEVGMGKVEYDGNLNDLFSEDINKFVAYNLTDIDIVDAIDKKMKLIDLVVGMCHICHVPYENYLFSSKYLEGAILTYLRRQGRVAPNKPRIQKKDEDMDGSEDGFRGAYVKDPIVGRHDWVFSVDINSLYPSAIRSLNISPETKRGKILNWNKIRNQDNPLPINKWNDVDVIIELGNQESTVSMTDFKDAIIKNKFSVSSAGIIYSQDSMGIIPEILEKWYNERKDFKKLAVEAGKNGNPELEQFYDKRQHVQKILLNSLYGVLGLPVFRFYDVDNAESVTLTGQDIIKATGKYTTHLYKKILNELGSESNKDDYVVYSDTDSVAGSSIVITNNHGDVEIQTLFSELFNSEPKAFSDISGRDFVIPDNLSMPYYDDKSRRVKFGKVKFIERHSVKKRMFRIKSKTGKYIDVTEDHAIMVMNDSNELIEKTPLQLKKGDKIITI